MCTLEGPTWRYGAARIAVRTLPRNEDSQLRQCRGCRQRAGKACGQEQGKPQLIGHGILRPNLRPPGEIWMMLAPNGRARNGQSPGIMQAR